MPFRSNKQKSWMFANKPGMAREWTDKYGAKAKPDYKKHLKKVKQIHKRKAL